MRKLLWLALLWPTLAMGAQFETSRLISRVIETTVANLPSSPSAGTIRIVTDGANTSDCTVGNDTNRVLCSYNGSAWTALGSGSGTVDIPETVVASLPAAPSSGVLYFVTDGASASDCSTGSGATRVLCEWDGDSWNAIGAGVSDHGNLSGLSDDDHSAIYIKFEAAAAAGSCDRNGQIQSVVADLKIYPCFSNGGNPIEIGDMIVNYVQITGDSGATTASASDDVLNIAGGVGLTTTATSDTLTIDIDNHVKSVFFPAASLVGDGTNCPTTPTAVTINSGPLIYTFICGDNDASTLYGVAHMPDSWNGGTVTFSQSYIQTAADTSALNGDITAQCRGNAETPSSTWGTEVAIDDAGVTGSNANDWTVSSAVTPAGTCAGGDMLYFRWQMDATGTTTAVATLHFLGFKMEYTVVGAGSD